MTLLKCGVIYIRLAVSRKSARFESTMYAEKGTLGLIHLSSKILMHTIIGSRCVCIDYMRPKIVQKESSSSLRDY